MKSKWELILAALLAAVFVSLGYAIYDTARSQEARESSQTSWTGPDIPVCDKELWLRIKDRCGEAG